MDISILGDDVKRVHVAGGCNCATTTPRSGEDSTATATLRVTVGAGRGRCTQSTWTRVDDGRVGASGVAAIDVGSL